MSMNVNLAYQTTMRTALASGAYPGDVVVDQPYALYGAAEQQTWRTLWRRQSGLMPKSSHSTRWRSIEEWTLARPSQRLRNRPGFRIICWTWSIPTSCSAFPITWPQRERRCSRFAVEAR